MKAWFCKILFFFLIINFSLYAIDLSEHEWIREQIAEDFAPFVKGIQENDLDETMEMSKIFSTKDHYLLRVKVINSIPYIFNKNGKLIDVPIITYHLHKIMENQALPDIDFIYFYGGGPEIAGYPPTNFAKNGTGWADKHLWDYGQLPLAPILSGNKTDELINLVLFHDRMTSGGNNHYTWSKVAKEVEETLLKSPWNHKSPMLSWIGQTSDFKLNDWANINSWTDYSKRGKLLSISKNYPDLMNIGITSYGEVQRRNISIRNFYTSPYRSINDQMLYKYQIVLDGFTCTNPGYAWRLLSNCVCLKLDSPKRQWFYKGLQPGVHYLPIKEDFSNLVETLHYLRDHDDYAYQISMQGREWAKKNLVNEELLHYYCSQVLLKYASLQTFQPKLTSEERQELFSCSEYAKLKNLLPFNPHGFFSNDNANALSFLIKKYQCNIVVELGSWMGSSTRHIAKCLPENGLVYAIDHWKGNEEHFYPDRTDVHNFLPTLYEQFLSNCIHARLTHKIIPERMTTLYAAKCLTVKADLIFVDASHDEESVYNDLVAWYPHLKKSGILCGDDWYWNKTANKSYPIQNAVKRFAKERQLYFETYGTTFWMLKDTEAKILSF
ncbi:MAG: hypothetical protein KR126chlam6_01129 [Candidatus Anoxychlamydiales bacterium]|nr:hypothetical protein [Candidatus Anoxychlamydiales bacterium]